MTAARVAALAYAQRGWRVFPLHGIVNGACTCGHACASPGKHPLVRRGLYDATTDPALVSAWWRAWRRANVGVATGAESGIAVVDVDLPTALASLDELVEAGIGRTLTALTGGGGIHFFYSCADGELGNSAGRLPGFEVDLPGVDLRSNGGYVVAPPSVHRSGARYLWFDETADLAPAPSWLRRPRRGLVTPYAAAPAGLTGDATRYGDAVLRQELRELRAAAVGSRNHRLNRAAFAVAQVVAGGELRESAARASLLQAALQVGLDEGEARQTIESAFSAGIRLPRCAPHRLRSPSR